MGEFARETPRYGMVEIARYVRSLGIKDMISLNVGEPDFETPKHVRAAAIEAINSGQTHYTPPEGLPQLREAISQKLRKENNLSYLPEQITVVCGSQEGVSVIARTLFGPGDEVLVGNPYYPASLLNITLQGAKPVLVPVREENNYQLLAADLERAVTSKTKAIMIITPNNPTGGIQSLEELRKIAELSKKYDLLVISDEIYEHVIYPGHKHYSIGSLPGMADRTITQNGFSKAYAMTGWRIGYFAAPKEISEKLQMVHRATAICSPSMSQHAALAALMGPQDCVAEMTHEFAERKDMVVKMLQEIPELNVAEPAGTFYVFPDISFYSKDDEELVREIIREAHVALLPGSGFGSLGKGHLRLSFASSRSKLQEGLTRLQNFFREKAKRN